MKKNLFIIAAAALALASCSNDEIIESAAFNDSNAISFQPFTTGITRAADVDLASNGFIVTATKTGDASTIYFSNVKFTNDGGTYTSATKYYWPSGYNLDFYAYSPTDASIVGSGKQIIPWNTSTSAYDETSYKVFKVTPDEAAANQVDLVYANTNDWGKVTTTPSTHIVDGSTVQGVTINFRHTESKVRIRLYNSNSNINVIVRDASICNVKTSGVFTYSDTNTDGQNTGAGTVLTSSTWTASGNGDYTVTDQSDTKYNQTASGSAVQVSSQDWILIPQTFTYATAYSGSSNNDPFNGPCIKINLKIKNNATGTPGAYIVGADDDALDDDDNEGYVTAMWPLAANPAAGTGWEKGKQYTYTVDLAGGGYYPANTNDGDADLDPILEGAEIKFVSVTVDSWATDIPSGTYTVNLPE